MTTFNVDLVADFGGSFDSWNTFARAQASGDIINLSIPAGTFNFGSASDILHAVAPGPTKSTVNVTGAGIDLTTLQATSTFRSPFGDNAFTAHGAVVPRIEDAYAGDTSVTLVDPADHTKYTVGQHIEITGIDMQNFGYPPNNAYFEYVEVTAIDNITGVLTLATPLTKSYKNHWPQWLFPSPFQDDCGGPATAIPCRIGWDREAYINDLTLNFTSNIGTSVRILGFNRVKFGGSAYWVTWTQSAIYNDCDMGTDLYEPDKGITHIEYNNCTSATHFFMQSSSTGGDKIIFRNGHLNVTGGGNPEIYDSTVDTLRAFITGYGFMRSMYCENVYSDTVQTNIGTVCNFSSFTPSVTFDTSNGDIIFPDNAGQFATFLCTNVVIPGNYISFGKNNTVSGHGLQPISPFFKVLDLFRRDTDLLVVSTNFHEVALGFEAIADGLLRPAALSVTVNGGYGALECLSHPNGHGRSAGSYYHQLVRGFGQPYYQLTSTALRNAGSIVMTGEVQKVEFNVIKPYTGVRNPILTSLVNFSDVWNNQTLTFGDFQPVVNLKIAGVRTLLPGSTIGTQSGDNFLTLDVGTCFVGMEHGAAINESNIPAVLAEGDSVWPVFSLEIETDMGIARTDTSLGGF